MEKYLIKSKPIKEESSETNNSGTQYCLKQIRVELNLDDLYRVELFNIIIYIQIQELNNCLYDFFKSL